MSDIKAEIQSDIDDLIHFASENVLARDWLLPEEDAVWSGL